MEHEERFTRIEVTLERLADVQLRGENSLEQMAISLKQLLTAQVLMADSHQKLIESHQKLADSHQKLADAQRKTDESLNTLAVKSAETQDKLDALIHMWDDWIRERGGRNGEAKGGPPKP